LSQKTPFHILSSYVFIIHLNIFLPSASRSYGDLFPSGFSAKTLYALPTQQKYGHGSRRSKEPRTTVLAKASSKLLLCSQRVTEGSTPPVVEEEALFKHISCLGTNKNVAMIPNGARNCTGEGQQQLLLYSATTCVLCYFPCIM
jgi:hypothetical protein